MILENFQFKKYVTPIDRQRVTNYNFIDWSGSLDFVHHNFYLFWGDEGIKVLMDFYPELIQNMVSSGGKVVYVSMQKFIVKKSLIFLYNFKSLWGGDVSKEEVLKSFNSYSLIEAFKQLRDLFLDLGVDLAKVRTQSQLSSSLYRFNFLFQPQFAPDYRVRRLALRSAVGDFKQVYKMGDFKGAFRMYDGKAFYPNCILSLKTFPSAQDWVEAKTKEEFLDEKNKGGFCKVFFRNRTSFYLCGRRPSFYDEKGYGSITLSEFRNYQAYVDFKFIEGWYYRSGDTSLYDYQSCLMELREKHKHHTLIYMLIKNLQNFIVGKFLQKSRRTPISYIRKLCLKYKLPFSMAIDTIFPEDKEFKLAQIGSAFYPEWYSLITGWGRSVEAQAVLKSEPYIALSDAVITPRNFGSGFWVGSQEFTKKGEGDRLIVVNQNNYILEGVKANKCGYSRSTPLPLLRQSFLEKLKKRLDKPKENC